MAVVTAVSDHEGRPPTSLPPLAETIDPDALNAVIASLGENATAGSGRVSFPYSSSRVTVDHDEGIRIGPVEETTV